MSITDKALNDLAELVGYEVCRREVGSQYFELLSPRRIFDGMFYKKDRAFMHLLWVALDLGLSPEEVKAAVTWEPNITQLEDGSRVYSDVSHDSSVDAMVSRVWYRPEPPKGD